MLGTSYIRSRLMRWTELIEDPIGFPDQPSHDHCWIWAGAGNKPRTYTRMAKRGPDKPRGLELIHSQQDARASFLGDNVAPHRVMIAFHQGVDLHEVGRTRNVCNNRLCINPLHYVKVGEAPSRAYKHEQPYERRQPEQEIEYEPEPQPEFDEQTRAFRQLFRDGINITTTPEQALKQCFNRDFVENYLGPFQDFVGGKTLTQIKEELRLTD